MRSFLLATTFGAAQSLAVTNKSKKPAVQALMESATTMLKNGATPQVVTFAQLTLDEVTTTVMPAIIAESVNDQTFIDNLFARFEVITNELIQGNLDINALNIEETNKGAEHLGCRNAEHLKCYGDAEFDVPAIETCAAVHEPGHHADQIFDGQGYHATESSYGEGKRPCEGQLCAMWEAWVTAEDDLRIYHDEIHGLFCPTEANGTTKAFRVSASEWMRDYMLKKTIVDQKLVDYDNKVLCCEVAHGALEEKSYDCNLEQDALEEKACEHASKIHAVLNVYYRDYAQAASAYNCAEEEVRQLESDRKKEWVTLEVVRCLLDRIELQNGVPCDESTGTVTDAVGVCEQRHAVNICDVQDADLVTHSDDWSAEDVRKLCIDYPVVIDAVGHCEQLAVDRPDVRCIDHPPFCDGRNSVVGNCRPEPIPTPCSVEASLQWTYYDNLPAVPVSTFTCANPGCNAYPECSTCAERNYPPHPRLNYEDFLVDTCPGYTVDGCHTDGVDDNPLTFIRSVNGLADVRCCATAGIDMTCRSQDFVAFGDQSPVDFTTPGGGTHTGCYFDVTYQTALQVCHEVGMRICTVAEMDSAACCGTGCWHNHHAVWVDIQGESQTAVQYQTRDQHEEQRQLQAENQEWRCQQGFEGWPACQGDEQLD